MKYSDLLPLWWNGYKNDLMETTTYKKEWEMEVHILPWLGDYDVTDITEEIMLDYINAKLKAGSPQRGSRGLSPSSIHGHFKIIKPSLDWAVQKGYLAENPAKGIRLPRVETKEIKVFKHWEVNKLIEVARPKWLGDMILLSYRTGMRRGEIYGLKWDDVDFDNQFLMVRRSIETYAPGVKLIHTPKTRSSIRRIMLDNASIEMLHRRQLKGKSEWVFENKFGELMSPWYTTKYMAEACKKAGIQHRSFHVLRHTHATVLLAGEVNPKIVQERLGHAKIATTLDTYSHVLPTMQKVAVEVFDNIV